ncbi:MAG: tRNA dihydrouridine(20/20a) synthase DusA [Xanthomonadales bacterium]|nr:tRNA dihydrouridine(20/20a) synthase DusA [Xanthomonadales bacterium]
MRRTLSVAPMMDWTDRHCRFLHRLIAPDAWLYTEMVVEQAVRFGPRERLLGFDPAEHPVALQLGGAEPRELAEAAAIGAAEGYDEINLNCGCPSDRVQSGRFGACLMREPDRVAEAVVAMREAVGPAVPVTVKCRLGVDDDDSEAFFRQFIERVAEAGCRVFVVHARKAWLNGLSPKENREIPPLDYERVFRLKRDRPDLCVILNGGLDDGPESLRALSQVDGVMLGRHAYHEPWSLARLAHRIARLSDGQAFDQSEPVERRPAVVADYVRYMRVQMARGVPVRTLLRPLLGLFQGLPGARMWRRSLSGGDLQPLQDQPERLLELIPHVIFNGDSGKADRAA